MFPRSEQMGETKVRTLDLSQKTSGGVFFFPPANERGMILEQMQGGRRWVGGGRKGESSKSRLEKSQDKSTIIDRGGMPS